VSLSFSVAVGVAGEVGEVGVRFRLQPLLRLSLSLSLSAIYSLGVGLKKKLEVC
jgi:hypothetical protein